MTPVVVAILAPAVAAAVGFLVGRRWSWAAVPVAVAGSGLALEQALQLAGQLGRVPSDAAARIKELVNQWPGNSLVQQAALERDHLLQSLRSAGATDGPAAAPVSPT